MLKYIKMSRIRIRIRTNNNRSGSGRPKSNGSKDPNPKHWSRQKKFQILNNICNTLRYENIPYRNSVQTTHSQTESQHHSPWLSFFSPRSFVTKAGGWGERNGTCLILKPHHLINDTRNDKWCSVAPPPPTRYDLAGTHKTEVRIKRIGQMYRDWFMFRHAANMSQNNKAGTLPTLES
jgi:hypothetical protein